MFIGYDLATGRITQTIEALQDEQSRIFYADQANWPPGEGFVSAIDGQEATELFASMMVQNGNLVLRPIMPLLRDAVSFPMGETYRFSGIPKGAWVRFDGKEGECDDGVLDLTASEPGTYMLSIEKWPFLDAVVRVNVVPAQMEASS